MSVLRGKIVLLVVSFLALCASFIAISSAQQTNHVVAGVPVEVRSEHCSFHTWFVEIRLNRSSYSQENLERIWRFYCEKYPDKKDKLDMRVYAESTDSQTSSVGKKAYDHDAIFSRQGEGAIAFGGENEFYTFKPDLEGPEVKKNVQLSGRYPFLMDAYTGDPANDFVVAARSGDFDKVKALFEKGIDPNVKNNKGRAGLMGASNSGQVGMVNLLLARGADVNATDGEGCTALRDAVTAVVKDPTEADGWRWGHYRIAQMLLDNGALPNIQRRVWAPLLCAASHGSNDIVTLLLNHGADIEAKTDTGMTALARAIYDGQVETVRILLEAGADVNTRDDESNTPLMRAAIGHTEVVRLLIDKGANAHTVNVRGETALAIARGSHANREIIEMLLNAGKRRD